MPQPRVNVSVDLPGLPNLPGIPGLPGLPAGAPARPGGAATRAIPGSPGTAGTKLNRATHGAKPVATLPDHPDPVGELRFIVKLPGAAGNLGRFRECTGLAAEIEVKDYNEGGVNDRVHKLPTRMKYPNLVLKRGVTYEDVLLKWLYATQTPKLKRGPVTVSLVGPDGAPVRTWSFADAFPIKWTGPNLNAGSNQIATETLEIVHAGLQLQAGV